MATKVIQTNQGKIKGKLEAPKPELTDKKCYEFTKIPFATCERFEKPVAVSKWDDEVLDGTLVTPMQVQHNTLVEEAHKVKGVSLIPENIKEMTKDIPMLDGTLYCSVTTPENFESSPKKPVMVWIHGGGFAIGGVHEYNGRTLSTFGDVVIVCISYRLNALGFAFGNWGMWDQLEALKWVKNNIAAYGGDSENVTIFGESAGGASVDALFASEKTKGYFHKGISQSGCLVMQMAESEPMYVGAIETGKKQFNAETEETLKEALKKATNEELVEWYKVMAKSMMGFSVRSKSDDFFQCESHKKQKLFPNKLPLLTGMNSTEMGCMMLAMAETWFPGLKEGWTYEQLLKSYQEGAKMQGQDPEKMPEFIEEVKKIYSKGRDMGEKLEYSRMHSLYFADSFFLGCLYRAESICEEQPVHFYELNVRTKAFHEEPYKNGNPEVRPDFCRSDHGDDLIYMFGMMFQSDPNFGLSQGRYFSEEEKELARRMMKVWTDFARSSNPGWEKFDKNTKTGKRFDTPSDSIFSANDETIQARLALWKKQIFENNM